MSQGPEQVADGVYRVAAGAVNHYIVTEDGRVALIDTGWPNNWSNVEAGLEAIGHSPGDVEAILLTHGHPDHMGAAERARKETGAPVKVEAQESGRVRGESAGSSPFRLVPPLALQLWRPHTLKFVGEAIAKGFLFPTWLEEIETFTGGEYVETPGRPRAVPTPGHTEGHVSFELGDRGVLLAGDALVTTDPVTGREGPCLTHDVVNADPEAARESLGVLANSPTETLLPGHGEPWHGPIADAVERARAV